MSYVLKNNQTIKKLIELGVIIPGVFEGSPGNITYVPISIEGYLKRIESGNTHGLAFNTRTMGRGIFTFGENGEIINYKGVDSGLNFSDSIAVAVTDGEIENINGQESFGINVIRFFDQKLGQQSKDRLEFRIRGASPYEDLVFEKFMRDSIEKKDGRNLIKIPKLDFPTTLTKEMCERMDLPREMEVTDDFLLTVDAKSDSGKLLSQMKNKGVPFEKRNQLWKEYFSEHHREMLDDELLMKVIQKEDKKYQLGATFGQTTRILENPFRIMELQYYMRNNNIEALNAILEYSSQLSIDLLFNYANISARNAAGFMNIKYAFNNFEHRQDFPLSGEICDDAFDDVSDSLYQINPSKIDEYHQAQYESQVYIFATNMKVIEDAYRLTGREVPNNYKKHFVETFYNSLNDKAIFWMCFQKSDPTSNLYRFDNAEKNFSGMESYMQEIRQIAVDFYQEKNATRNTSHVQQTEHDQNYPDKD